MLTQTSFVALNDRNDRSIGSRARNHRRVISRSHSKNKVNGERISDNINYVPAKEVLEAIHIPESLAQIRAYVRWEEQGKPSETSYEWQANEYKHALLDLKLEVLRGVSLNDIRRRYEVDVVDGDDKSMFTMDEEVLKRMRIAEAMVEKVSMDAVTEESKGVTIDEFIKASSPSSSSSSSFEMTEEMRETIEDEARVIEEQARSIEHAIEESQSFVVVTEAAEDDFLQELQASTTFDAHDFLPVINTSSSSAFVAADDIIKTKQAGNDDDDDDSERRQQQKEIVEERAQAIAAQIVIDLKSEMDILKKNAAQTLELSVKEATKNVDKVTAEFASMKEQRNRLARELAEIELKEQAKDDEIKELNELLLMSEKDFKAENLEEIKSLKDSLESLKEEKKAAEVLARAYKQDFVKEKELNSTLREEKTKLFSEWKEEQNEMKADIFKYSEALKDMRKENKDLKAIWESDRKVIEILTAKVDEMSKKPGLGQAIVSTYSSVSLAIPKYSSRIASSTVNASKEVYSRTTEISGNLFNKVKSKLEETLRDDDDNEIAALLLLEDDDEFEEEESGIRSGIFL